MKQARVVPIVGRREPPRTVCPPHAWQLSQVEIDGIAHEHRECARCAAQQDVRQSATAQRRVLTA